MATKLTPMALTRGEVDHLKQLAAAGERGRTISVPTPQVGMKRLVSLRYVTDQAISMNTVLYVITDRGRTALAQAET